MATGGAVVAQHILGVQLVTLVATALRGIFLAWFLEAWLRRVAHQALLLRVLAVLALPACQGALVRYAYQYMPRSERLDRYSTGILRYAWPLSILLLVAYNHARYAKLRRTFAAWAFIFLTFAALAAGVDVATCDDFGPLAGGYWLGTLWAAHLAIAIGFALLLYASQVVPLEDIGVSHRQGHERSARLNDGTAPACRPMPTESSQAELMAIDLFTQPLEPPLGGQIMGRCGPAKSGSSGPAKRCASRLRPVESKAVPDPTVIAVSVTHM